jgi:hypothetical protein
MVDAVDDENATTADSARLCVVMDKLPMVFTLADAERCGLSLAAVRHALAQRRLVRVR